MNERNSKVRDNNIDYKKASMILEDLAWSLQKISTSELIKISDLLRSRAVHGMSESAVSETHKSNNPNKHFLIGVLPRLFQDRNLFPLNEDIAGFAKEVLYLDMSRSEKRSRYEIIGKVVCETNELDDKQLSKLVKALEYMVESKVELKLMAEKKKSANFSWNKAIQEMTKS